MKNVKTQLLSITIALLFLVGFGNSASATCDITPGNYDGHCWTIDTTWPDGHVSRDYSCGGFNDEYPADCNTGNNQQ